MNRGGFEALADATLLLLILILASSFGLRMAVSTPDVELERSLQLAEQARTALFRTTLNGLAYVHDSTPVTLRNGTSVETFLRLQVHILGRGDADFTAANARVTALAASLLPPGWDFSLAGGRVGERPLVAMPPAARPPPNHAESAWSYPPLDGEGPNTVLSIALWLSPRR